MLTWRPSGPRARCPGEEKGIVRLARLFLPCIVYELQSKCDETNWPLLCMTALMNRFSVIVHKLGVLEGATGKGLVHTERLRWFKFTHFLNLWNFIPRDHAFDWIKHHSGQGLCCLYRASMCFFHFVSVVPSPACSGLWDSMSATPLLLLVLLAAPDLNRKTRIRVVPAGPGSQAPGWDRMPQWKWEDTIATYARKNSKRDAG